MSQPKLEADFTNQKDAAKYAGVKSVRTIQRWKNSGMPVIDLGGRKTGYTKAALDHKKWISLCLGIGIRYEDVQGLYAEIEKAQLILDGLRAKFETVFHIVPDNEKQRV